MPPGPYGGDTGERPVLGPLIVTLIFVALVIGAILLVKSGKLGDVNFARVAAVMLGVVCFRAGWRTYWRLRDATKP